jgi:formylglycine-generating enzyme required for sulfatase activity/dienelactone hydrolase
VSTNWQRVEELFHQASDLPAIDRGEFLVCACGDDDAVHREVTALLAAEDSGKDLPAPFIPEGLRPGHRVDRFEILATCGQGAGGTVYSARETNTGRQVAIKVFPQFLTPEQRRRYVKEVHALSALSHPNIVGVVEAGRTGDRDFLVMEFVDGCNLGDIIPKGGMANEEALDLAGMMLAGLAAAHAAGIVHRDLKPPNVMRTRGGSIKVVDFGLAKHISFAGAERLKASMGTTTGQILGTPCYLSPEQARGEVVDARTDIFSFGAVLYEMLTGVKPFDRGSLAATLAAILRDTPAPVGELRAGIPADLSRHVQRCLEKDRNRRFASVEELSGALLQCRANVLSRRYSVVRALRRPRVALPVVAALAVLAVSASWRAVRISRIRMARSEIEPEITRLTGQHQYNAADVLTRQIEAIVPGDQVVRDFARDYRVVTSVLVSVAGAEVAIKDYGAPGEPWRAIGRSPLKNVTIPLGYLRWRVSEQGYRTREFAETGVLQPTIRFAIYADHTEPADMEAVPAGSTNGTSPLKVPQFAVDRFEVTNRKYQEFVDAGGYQRRDLWQQAMRVKGRSTTWEQAMAGFRDQTGRFGPAGWGLGQYPEGQADLPVTGVSWYEADAYARFAGKRLPVYSEWLRAARTEQLYSDATQAGNFSGRGLAPVGRYPSLGRFGTYDLAGNCKEWLWNQWGSSGQRMAMGGAWDEVSYQAGVPDAADPWERRANVGFRCVRSATPPPASFLDPVNVAAVRDYAREKPINDERFAAVRRLYDYSRTSLHARVEGIDESNRYWRKEKVSFDAPYSGERVTGYLFLPRGARPPYQTVLYFASGIAFREKSSEHLEMWYLESLIRGGRAVFYPVLWGMYERRPTQTAIAADRPFLTITRDVQDLRRSLDYLETRPELAPGKTALLGFSYGAVEGPIVLATDPRFQAAELIGGGLDQASLPVEIDPFQFAPHVRTPVLLVSGRYDIEFPVESAAGLLNLVATPSKDKKLVLLEAGHAMIGFPAATRESLEWLDRYLGPVPMPTLKR